MSVSFVYLSLEAQVREMFPVRCYTCNAVLAHRHAEFREHRSLAKLGLPRMCCRRMFLGHAELPLSNDPGHTDFTVRGIRFERRVHETRTAECD